MFDEDFINRLTQLRMQKNVSARDMSLSIGQSASYINGIENGKALPSMSAFFFICDYLNITPAEFFDTENRNPEQLRDIIHDLKSLDTEYLKNLSVIIKGLKNK